MEEKAVFSKQIYHLCVGNVEHWKNHSEEDISGEVWREMPNWEGKYWVSNMGRAWVPERDVISKSDGRLIRTNPAAIIRSCRSRGGYISFRTCEYRVMKCELVHRNVYGLFVSDDIEVFEINHIDGNKENNCWWNLEKLTKHQNVLHAKFMDLRASGERHPDSKFSHNQVLDIFNSAERCLILAQKYNVAIGVIHKIKNGETYGRVTGKKYQQKRIRLLPNQVIEILKSTLSGPKTAKKYGITHRMVYLIKSGKAHLEITKNIVK